MIRVFVQADNADGTPLVAHHFEFEVLPRIQDQVVVDTEHGQFLLRVTAVTHFADFKGTVTGLNTPILKCENLGKC